MVRVPSDRLATASDLSFSEWGQVIGDRNSKKHVTQRTRWRAVLVMAKSKNSGSNTPAHST